MSHPCPRPLRSQSALVSVKPFYLLRPPCSYTRAKCGESTWESLPTLALCKMALVLKFISSAGHPRRYLRVETHPVTRTLHWQSPVGQDPECSGRIGRTVPAPLTPLVPCIPIHPGKVVTGDPPCHCQVLPCHPPISWVPNSSSRTRPGTAGRGTPSGTSRPDRVRSGSSRDPSRPDLRPRCMSVPGRGPCLLSYDPHAPPSRELPSP